MLVIKIIFWVAVFLLFYIYFGYPVLLSLIAVVRQRPLKIDDHYQPSVSLVIAAYNEEAVIREKIENSLKLDYPKEKIKIIVFSDASNDWTDEIVKSYTDQGIKLLRIEGRKGKTYCQNEAAKIAQGEIFIFSDANSMYESDAIRKLVRNFADERVGCVSGELRYRRGKETVEGERTYLGYDGIIKRLESKVSSLVGANGSIYAIRKELFEPIPNDMVEDFVRPLKIVQKGHKIVYEPTAVNWESTAPNAVKELQRRVRMVTRSVHSLLNERSLLILLNPFRYGIFSIQLWSHKIFRWFSGIFLVLIFVLNVILVSQGLVYIITMTGQVAFYLLSLWGFLSEKVRKKKAPKLPHVAYYFCLSCYAMLKGIFCALQGRNMVTWETVRQIGEK